MKVLLINNPPFTSYTTLALTPHPSPLTTSRQGYVLSHIAYAYTAIEQRTPVQDVYGLCLALYLALDLPV